MKLKRNKKVRRILNFYKNSYSICAPYTVLLDGTFCKAALNNQVNIAEQMPKYLSAEVIIATTKCIIRECEQLGSLLYGPLKILLQYKVIDCKHKGSYSATKCLLYHCRNSVQPNYIAGTQDSEVSEQIRDLPHSPLIYIAHKSINLESPSELSQSNAASNLETRVNVTTTQMKDIDVLKKEVFGDEVKVIKKRRKKKGPNPLSCKKKKLKDEIVNLRVSQGIKKRTRSRHKSNIIIKND